MTSATFRAALIQITAGPEPGANAQHNAALVQEAATGGADFVMLPEVCNMIEPNRSALRQKVRTEDEDETIALLRETAAKAGVWVLIGSAVIAPNGSDGKLANRSMLIDSAGEIQGRYDKMHLFDVNVGSDDVYRESDTYQGGDKLALVETPWGPLGMTICYDLRFPHLYRDYAKAGAVMLTIPSAFTRPTGAAHWHVLLRARAIECGAFVFAPAQTGDHPGGRKTYGHGLAVDPWGEVLVDQGEEPGVAYAEIDTELATAARSRIPALKHDRDYTLNSGNSGNSV